MASGNFPNALQVFADPTYGLVIDAHPLRHSPVAGLWMSSQFPGDEFTNLDLCQLAAVEVQYQAKVRSLGCGDPPDHDLRDCSCGETKFLGDLKPQPPIQTFAVLGNQNGDENSTSADVFFQPKSKEGRTDWR